MYNTRVKVERNTLYIAKFPPFSAAIHHCRLQCKYIYKKTFSLILCAGIHHLESLPKSEPSDWTGRFGSEKAFLGKYWPNRSSLPCARI